MNTDRKKKLVKFLKIMSAYFGLYAIHYLILPNTPIHGRYEITGYFDISKFMMMISILLFPFFDILFLKSNILFGFLGIVLYSICVYIYDANAVYELGYSGIFYTSFSREWLVFQLGVLIVFYVIIYTIFLIIINIVSAIRKHIKNKKDKEEKS
ncbi:hypothetical protein HMPREF0379_0536 [[Eubacterium] yurii subsp. margaretiae ATCC 43715]|nr:hypothetical protein HMPREF0379_0536 [[Eubacterium] yurii subsp. margaretiae ATCC 43715]